MQALYPVLHQLRDVAIRSQLFVQLLLVCVLTTSILHYAASAILRRPAISELLFAAICISGLFVTGIVLSRRSGRIEARAIQRAVDVKTAEQLRLEAEFSALKSEVSPRYLTEALERITTFIPVAPDRAENALSLLGQVIRTTLHRRTTREVPLYEALDTLKPFVELERALLHGRLRVAMNVEEDVLDALLPDMVLQPLVAISARAQEHSTEPSLVIVARRDPGDTDSVAITVAGGGMHLTDFVCDDESEPAWVTPVRARLEHMYGARSSLGVSRAQAIGIACRLTVPCDGTTQQRVSAPEGHATQLSLWRRRLIRPQVLGSSTAIAFCSWYLALTRDMISAGTFLLVSWIAFGAILVVAETARYRRALRTLSKLETEFSNSLRQRARAKLRSLRAELDPHFLGNAVHAVAGLTRSSPERAIHVLRQLCQLLCAPITTSGRHDVSLAEELAMLHPYLEVERARMRGDLPVRWKVAPETLSGRVPQMILQPLVENAVRHGLANHGGRAGAGIEVHVCRKDERLVIEVSNDGGTVDAVDGLPRPGERVGLANTRARLWELYGDGASFELGSRAEGGAIARISVPWCETLVEPRATWRESSPQTWA